MTRTLLAEGFGDVVLATSLLAYAALIVDLGFDALGPLEVARGRIGVDKLAGTVVRRCSATFLHGMWTRGTPLSNTTREAAASWHRLNSTAVGQSSGCPQSQTTAIRSRIVGSSSNAEATLVIAPIART